ncbi:hypothetical protein STENM36S_07307 [Streptomyces tendae]
MPPRPKSWKRMGVPSASGSGTSTHSMPSKWAPVSWIDDRSGTPGTRIAWSLPPARSDPRPPSGFSGRKR